MRKVLQAMTVAALLTTLAAGVRAGDHEEYLEINGTTADSWFGGVVCHAGDVNADGYGDFLVSSLRDSTHAFRCGAVRVYSGKDGKVLHTLYGPKNKQAEYGRCLAALGDLNGDGCDDYAIGCPGDSTGGSTGGAIWIHSGKDAATIKVLYGEGKMLGLGASVAGLGDVDGDGTPDLAVGAPKGTSSVGYVFVLSGDDYSVILELSSAEFDGNGHDDAFGYAVACAGDVDADGTNDIIVSDSQRDLGEDSIGQAHVFSGESGKRLHTLEGTHVGRGFGSAVDGAGDVNADGHDDLIVGAPNADVNNRNEGVALVFSGKDGKVLYTIHGDSDNDALGTSVSGAGDVNGDGYDDFVVGSPNDNGLGDIDGAALVFSGKDGKLYLAIRGTTRDCQLGYSVDGGGDANNAGPRDIIVGAPTHGYPNDEVGNFVVWVGTGPWGAVEINDGDDYTNTETVTLGLTWKGTAAMSSMRVRNASDGIWGSWITLAATKSWTFPSGSGEKYIEAQFKDVDGDISGVARDLVHVDKGKPRVTVTMDQGATLTSLGTVDLDLTWGDNETAVAEMRIRGPGESWPAWGEPVASVSFGLPGPDGENSVEVQVRDLAGNESEIATDSILLDTTPPTLTVSVNDGDEFTADTNVTLALDAYDAIAGVESYRVRGDAAAWSAWSPYLVTVPMGLPDGDGKKTVEVQVRDRLGHESDPASAEITLDTLAPGCTSLSVNGNEPYVLASEPFVLGIQSKDHYGGSGVADFILQFSGVGAWSDPYALVEGYMKAKVAHPNASGAMSVRVIVRDAAGNVSEPRDAPFYRLEEHLVAAGGGGKLTGAIAPATDVDATSLMLTAGDLLTAKVQTKATLKGQVLDLALDLVRPDGTRLFRGRWPADAKKPMISKFPVPETGEYLLVLRRDPKSQATTGTYALTVKVKQSKLNKKAKGEGIGESVSFEAAEGQILKAKLAGVGLTAAGVTLTGPEGAIPLTFKEKNGKVTILPVVLSAGSGTYTIGFGSSLSVKHTVSLKLPKKTKAAIGE